MAGPAENLAQAREIIRKNGGDSYFILSQKTRHKNLYEVDKHGSVRPLYLPSGRSSTEVI